MFVGRSVLAIIPAKENSSRLPDKNIQEIGGVSLVGWAILAARESKFIDTVVVSTDGSWISSEAFKRGADIVLKRPSGLCKADTPSVDVVRHVIRHVPADFVVLLQPTSPIRRGAFIDLAIMSTANLGIVRPTCSVNSKGKQDGAVYAFSTFEGIPDDVFEPEVCRKLINPAPSVDIDTWTDLIEAQHIFEKSRNSFPDLYLPNKMYYN